jgi:hypothetical protein
MPPAALPDGPPAAAGEGPAGASISMEAPSVADRVELEKELARRAPDLPWKDWALFTGLKSYVGIGLFILDAWIAAVWLEAGNYVGLIPSLVLAVYLEFLLYRYLWYRPSARASRSKRRFRPSWSRPVEYGRWTPEAARRRSGAMDESGGSPVGPNPRDFL